MIISRKKFEREIRERTELELKKFHERRDKEDREREILRIIDSLHSRIEKIEEQIGIPTNLMSRR